MKFRAQFQYAVGQMVEARDPATGAYRRAWLMTHKPYYSRGKFISDGWYIQWETLPRDPRDPYFMPSSGGWVSVNYIRPTAAVQSPAPPQESTKDAQGGQK